MGRPSSGLTRQERELMVRLRASAEGLSQADLDSRTEVVMRRCTLQLMVLWAEQKRRIAVAEAKIEATNPALPNERAALRQNEAADAYVNSLDSLDDVARKLGLSLEATRGVRAELIRRAFVAGVDDPRRMPSSWIRRELRRAG